MQFHLLGGSPSQYPNLETTPTFHFSHDRSTELPADKIFYMKLYNVLRGGLYRASNSFETYMHNYLYCRLA